MPRYVIQLGYDGTGFFGWQKQPDARTVQGELEQALKTLIQEEIQLYGSGRTDTGVHAEDQHAHFDVHIPVERNWLTRRLQRLLPDDILVRRIVEVPEHFHARFDARWRQYRYQILLRPDPFKRLYAWYPGHIADWDVVDRGLDLLRGGHDFSGFSKRTAELPHCRCHIHEAGRSGPEGHCIFIRVRANRFLRSMMRAIVGGLVSVGQGVKDPDWFQKKLQEDTELGNMALAPPHGLFLEKVSYPGSVSDLT